MVILIILGLVLASFHATNACGAGLYECRNPPRNCKEIYDSGIQCSGVYTIKPDNLPGFDVYCDMDTNGGGWTVFQRRMDGTEDFYRGWNDYVAGFGSLDGEFWLGLNHIHRLTADTPVELRVDIRDFEGRSRYAKYATFTVGNADTKYQLNVGEYTGNAGDSLQYHNNLPFTTNDNDNDDNGNNCAVEFKGAWWYKACHESNLNGLYLVGQTEQYATGVVWYGWLGHYYSLMVTEMKLR